MEKRIWAYAIVVAAASVVPATGSAQQHSVQSGGEGSQRIEIGYSDLDLRDEAAVEELERRVAQATARLCRAVGREPLGIYASARCREQARASAREQMRLVIGRTAERQLASGRTVEPSTH